MARWSSQSPMYWSVSPNSLLGSRGNQPDNTRLHILLSPADTEDRSSRGEREHTGDIEGRDDTKSKLRIKVIGLIGTVEPRHMGAFVPWGLFLEVLFQSTPLVHVIHVNRSSMEEWGKAKSPSLAAVALLRFVFRLCVCVCQISQKAVKAFSQRNTVYGKCFSEGYRTAPDIKAWHLRQAAPF